MQLNEDELKCAQIIGVTEQDLINKTKLNKAVNIVEFQFLFIFNQYFCISSQKCLMKPFTKDSILH